MLSMRSMLDGMYYVLKMHVKVLSLNKGKGAISLIDLGLENLPQTKSRH